MAHILIRRGHPNTAIYLFFDDRYMHVSTYPSDDDMNISYQTTALLEEFNWPQTEEWVKDEEASHLNIPDMNGWKMADSDKETIRMWPIER